MLKQTEAASTSPKLKRRSLARNFKLLSKPSRKTPPASTLKRALATLLAFLMAFSVITPSMTVTVYARELTAANTRFSVYSNDPSAMVGEGINAITGVFTRSSIDLELTSGQGLRFIRTYNVLNTQETAMGTGWRHNFMFELEVFEVISGEGLMDEGLGLLDVGGNPQNQVPVDPSCSNGTPSQPPSDYVTNYPPCGNENPTNESSLQSH